jgi:hypothetical protein
MRVSAALVYVVLTTGSALAGVGEIAPSRVEAFSAPSSAAGVAAVFEHGAQVCILDNTNYAGLLYHRLGWVAIRVPGGVAYLPAEVVAAVDPATSAAQLPGCEAVQGTSGGAASDPEQAPSPRPSPTFVVPPAKARDLEAPETDRAALLAGLFVPLRPARFMFGLGGGFARVSEQSATQAGIGDSGATMSATLGFTIYDLFMVSSAFSVAFPSDYRSFSQDVMPQFGGDTHSADSSLSVATYSVAAGLRTPFLALGSTPKGWVAAALFGEYGIAGFSASRSIGDCGDCREDDLHMTGGSFWHAGLDLLVPSRSSKVAWGLTAAYRRYVVGAAFTDEIYVDVGMWL